LIFEDRTFTNKEKEVLKIYI